MKKLLFAAASIALLISMTGCCNSCRTWSLRDMWANRPTPVRDLLSRGDACNTCNPPLGRVLNPGANLAPACDCPQPLDQGYVYPEGQLLESPIGDGAVAPGAPYYPDSLMDSGDMPGTLQTQNYAPSESATDAIGSAVRLEAPSVGRRTDVESPPMYGLRKIFN